MAKGPFLVVLSLLACACGNDVAEHGKEELATYAKNLLPEGAFDIREETNLPWAQISFNVRRAPLEFAIDSGRLRRAKGEGWLLCEPPTDEWTGYEDASQTPTIYTQHRKYLLHRDGVVLMVVGMIHYENEQQALRASDARTHQVVQEVFVVSRNSSADGARREAEEQGLVCP